jgi:hypothetical protein
MYYSALRTEEAVNLRARNLDLQESGYGWIRVDKAAPETERHWTDSGTRRDERSLKHRAAGETRRIPCPADLVQILSTHLDAFGTDANGRLFRGQGRPAVQCHLPAHVGSRAQGGTHPGAVRLPARESVPTTCATRRSLPG